MSILPHQEASVENRFWPRVAIGAEDGCWEWLGFCPLRDGKKRYGRFWFNGANIHAQRMAFELFWGVTVPKWLMVCHECDNPPCCNPAHLFIGTNQDNVDDRQSKGRQANGEKSRAKDQARGERQGLAKLTEEKVREIRRLRSEGWIYKEIAKKMGISKSNVCFIIKGDTWRHV